MFDISGDPPAGVAMSTEQHPAGELGTARGPALVGPRLPGAQGQEVIGTAATSGGKQWLDLSRCDRCCEAIFEGSFSGLGQRAEQPGFTILSSDGDSYHFAVETFAERARWVKLLVTALQGPRTLCTSTAWKRGSPVSMTGSSFGQEDDPSCSQLSSLYDRSTRTGDAHADDISEVEPENEARRSCMALERKKSDLSAVGPTLSEAMKVRSRIAEELTEAKSDVNPEQEINARLERKCSMLEEGLAAVRSENERRCSSLKDALDRLAFAESSNVGVGRGVAETKALAAGPQQYSEEELMTASIALAYQQMTQLEATLKSYSVALNGQMESSARQLAAGKIALVSAQHKLKLTEQQLAQCSSMSPPHREETEPWVRF